MDFLWISLHPWKWTWNFKKTKKQPLQKENNLPSTSIVVVPAVNFPGCTVHMFFSSRPFHLLSCCHRHVLLKRQIGDLRRLQRRIGSHGDIWTTKAIFHNIDSLTWVYWALPNLKSIQMYLIYIYIFLLHLSSFDESMENSSLCTPTMWWMGTLKNYSSVHWSAA